MSDLEEDMPDDKDSSRSALDVDVVVGGDGDGNGDREKREEDENEEDSDDVFVIDDRVSSRAAPKSGQSEGGDTEDDPAGSAISRRTMISSPKAAANAAPVDFSRISSSSANLDDDDEGRVDPMPIPPAMKRRSR